MDKEETVFDRPEEEAYISNGLPVYQITALCTSILMASQKRPDLVTIDCIANYMDIAKIIIQESLKGKE